MLKPLCRLPGIYRAFHSSAVRRSALDMEVVHTAERLGRLRDLMKRNKVDIYSKMQRLPMVQTAD